MKLINVLGVSVMLTAMSGSAALAKTTFDASRSGNEAAVVPLPKANTLADSVVVTPQNQPAQPVAAAATTAPAAPNVNVEPAQPTYVEPRKTVVHENEHQNYMSTIAVSALMGAVAGALIGGAIYYLGDNQEHPQRIAYWAAGGVLVGTGVGLVNVMVEESRANRAVASRLPTDPAPTYRLALVNMRF